ncbi:hypothetical protein ZOSMA_54G00670 [Zostera marina]|uniref:Uncharacterized protein n=1 Tax=Zostera marina TaxID=29655 RepID=A0A0K9NWK7_ZOSMR|nr:hypothetical protein ZOSMA_54G00670 [Zostera marina]
MSGKEETRIFVGGLSWETTERRLEDTFSRYGKVLEAQIMLERDTGRPRGFGFVTFADQRAVDDSIREMHGRDLDGRSISVNKAEPKVGSDGPGYGFGGGGYSSAERGGGYTRNAADRPPPPGQSDCFKCGRPGHWARECPSAGGAGGKFSSRPRLGSSTGVGRGDRFGGSDRYGDRYGDRLGGSDRYGDRPGGTSRYGDRYVDDRYDGGRYGDRDRLDTRDSMYSSGRDRYGNDRYPAGGDRFAGDRYGGASDRYAQNGFSKDTGYGRDAPRGGGERYGGGDRYGGAAGAAGRYEGGAGYRERAGPYDRPSRGRRPSYDDRI